DNRRRNSARHPVLDVIHKYPADYKLVFVGDATMSPYEISYPGGSVEHHNEEPGAAWMQRLLDVYQKAAWINPQPEDRWGYYDSVGLLRSIMGGRMFPLTLEGLDRAMRELVR
ncbi:MAG: VWA domain-containing protein, partial [Betaproteobacteria bacterium]